MKIVNKPRLPKKRQYSVIHNNFFFLYRTEIKGSYSPLSFKTAFWNTLLTPLLLQHLIIFFSQQQAGSLFSHCCKLAIVSHVNTIPIRCPWQTDSCRQYCVWLFTRSHQYDLHTLFSNWQVMHQPHAVYLLAPLISCASTCTSRREMILSETSQHRCGELLKTGTPWDERPWLEEQKAITLSKDIKMLLPSWLKGNRLSGI